MEFANASNGILSFKNLPFLYLSIILLKGLHELDTRMHVGVMGVRFLKWV